MRKSAAVFMALLALGFSSIPRVVFADIMQVSHCQKKIARAGAHFAVRVINATLEYANAISSCQIPCEQGVFGPPCDPNPPPCCEPADPQSNQAFGQCMAEADELCAKQAEKIDRYELDKQTDIAAVCDDLSEEELCGAEQPGLHFELLNAGCQALDPNYVCNLTNLINCVGGPLERQLLDQISLLLDPRAGEAIAALGLQDKFPSIPIMRKVKQQVAAAKADIWAIDGDAGDEVSVAVRNRDDNGDGTSNLKPDLALLDSTGQPVADTPIRRAPCRYPTPCGGDCPQLKRALPFSGTFYLMVSAQEAAGCLGGAYRMIVVSPGGATPVLVQDDVTPPVVA